jgi:hypothetical protein
MDIVLARRRGNPAPFSDREPDRSGVHICPSAPAMPAPGGGWAHPGILLAAAGNMGGMRSGGGANRREGRTLLGALAGLQAAPSTGGKVPEPPPSPDPPPPPQTRMRGETVGTEDPKTSPRPPKPRTAERGESVAQAARDPRPAPQPRPMPLPDPRTKERGESPFEPQAAGYGRMMTPTGRRYAPG